MGRFTLSHTLFWTLFSVTALLGLLSPFRHWGKVRSGGDQASGMRPQAFFSDRGYKGPKFLNDGTIVQIIPLLFLPAMPCEGRGKQQQEWDCHCVSGLLPKVGSTAEALQCAPTAGCSWQGPVTSNVPSFSFVFSLTHPILSDGLLAALTGTLKSSPFKFQGAQILSSPEEEAFRWVAVNYILENFFKVKDDSPWGTQSWAEQLLLTGSHRDTWRDG